MNKSEPRQVMQFFTEDSRKKSLWYLYLVRPVVSSSSHVGVVKVPFISTSMVILLSEMLQKEGEP